MIANMVIHVTDVECIGSTAIRVWFDDGIVKEVTSARIQAAERPHR